MRFHPYAKAWSRTAHTLAWFGRSLPIADRLRSYRVLRASASAIGDLATIARVLAFTMELYSLWNRSGADMIEWLTSNGDRIAELLSREKNPIGLAREFAAHVAVDDGSQFTEIH